jgi:ABC-2 type transport system ATP-binding protein
MVDKVTVRELRKSYLGVPAVGGISFEVRAGEIFGLLGPNGAGKTTTLECLAGLRRPDSGELHVCGVDVARHPQAAKRKLGVALHDTGLPKAMTPREALRLFGSFYDDPAAPEPLLERFGLVGKAGARYGTLSGGQRQRLALALAFVNQPEVVILDEPTAGLDPTARREFHAAIARMREEGCTLLLATHDLEEAERLCDRVGIIDRGKLVAIGTPGELIARSSAIQIVTLTTVQPLGLEDLARLPALEDLRGSGVAVQFRTGQTSRTLGALSHLLEAKQVEVVDLQVRRASLEEVFFDLVRPLSKGDTPPRAGSASPNLNHRRT